MAEKKNTRYHMLYPNELLEKIDKIQEDKGFTSRAQTVIHLLYIAVNEEEKRGGKNK